MCHVEFQGAPEDAQNWYVGSKDIKNAFLQMRIPNCPLFSQAKLATQEGRSTRSVDISCSHNTSNGFLHGPFSFVKTRPLLAQDAADKKRHVDWRGHLKKVRPLIQSLLKNPYHLIRSKAMRIHRLRGRTHALHGHEHRHHSISTTRKPQSLIAINRQRTPALTSFEPNEQLGELTSHTLATIQGGIFFGFND